MAKRDYNTKQTPSNTVCSKGSQAGWGSDGKVHCFNSPSSNRGDSSYPTGGSHGNSDHGGHASRGGSGYSNNQNSASSATYIANGNFPGTWQTICSYRSFRSIR